MVVFKKNLINIRSFKNRFNYKSKEFNFNHYSQYAIVSLNEAVLELVHLGLFKNTLKKLKKKKKKVIRRGKYRRKKKVFRLKNIRIEGIIGKMGKKKMRTKFRKIWMNLRPNHVLSRKSRNARMGKGKGSFERWCLKLRQGTTIIESIGLPKKILQRFVFWFNKKSVLKLKVVDNVRLVLRLNVWGSANLSYIYLQKYRYQ